MSTSLTSRAALIALLATAALALTPATSAQEDPQAGGVSRTGELVLDPQDVQVMRYTPKHVSTRELVNVLQQSFGRSYRLSNRTMGQYTANIQQVGDTLLVIDTAEYAAQLTGMIAQIDVASDETGSQTTRAYHPRHASASRAGAVIEAAGATILRVDTSQAPVIVAMGTERHLAQADARLAAIDVAPPRFMLECLVLRGTKAAPAADARPPEELQTNLARLVGFDHFEVATRGMLTAVAERNRDLTIELPSDTAPCTMAFELGDYDATTDELSFSRCEALVAGQRLQTSVRARAGEYLVVAATGQVPIFVVLRMTPLD